MKHKLARWIAVIAITLALLLPQGLAADIDGAVITSGTPTTRTFVFTQTTTALGGANKSINATTETQTLAWQAFYGNITANITLETTTGAQFYSWTSHNGTVLASRNNSIDFTTMTALNNCSADQMLTGTGSDRTNLTFTPSNNTLFEIGGITISSGTACTTHTYVNSLKQTSKFEEILLQATGVPTIYATRIETNTTGFDGKQHDFQIILPDHTNSTTSAYYIYVAIE